MRDWYGKCVSIRKGGGNAETADGSAAWFEWARTEMVWRYNNDAYYWPIYRE
jgi:hypothetical protein